MTRDYLLDIISNVNMANVDRPILPKAAYPAHVIAVVVELLPPETVCG